MARKAKATEVAVDSIKHQETRKNIPTEELRGFVAEEEGAPKMVKYPRDPSLDPQLVWKGKDEQDSKALEVPSVPIYIQEKIHPQALIEDLLRQQKKTKNQPETKQASLDLFSDFNGLPPGFDNKVDFYHHEGHWSNRMILGDSLLVMTSLAEKEGLKGKAQMIYIDPPYGIKFGSNWQVSTRKRDVKDGKTIDATRQPEQVKAFRDTWELGIHSYLSYIRDRLIASRELLSESGSVFIQIGDENNHIVRCVCDEVMGSENFCGIIFVAKTTGFGSTKLLPAIGDFLLWYSKDINQVKYRQLFLGKGVDTDYAKEYKWLEDSEGNIVSYKATPQEVAGVNSGASSLFRPDQTTSQGSTGSGNFSVAYNGTDFTIDGGHHWKTSLAGMNRLGIAGRLIKRDKSLSYKRYLNDFPFVSISNNWMDLRWGFDASDKRYVVETNPGIVERCILMTTDPGDLVVDPTCGSGTTAAVAEQWGRRWITMDTSRVALALARTRLMSARFPYYYLADSPEGLEKKAEATSVDAPIVSTQRDMRKGFVYQQLPHVTLKSIANNEEIDAIHSRCQPELDEIRAQINRSANSVYEDWQVPRESNDALVGKLLVKWWSLRRKCQKEIDASICNRAELEVLYDRPYEDKSKVRVSGPFTVESLSPHRVLPADDDLDGKVEMKEGKPFQDFTTMILENLKKAGIQNTKRKEKIDFDSLEPYAGRWIQAIGTYTDMEHRQRKVGISIGPEFGTVSPHQVKEAAKEAVQGLGFDLLAICGFAFDPYVSEEAKTFGRLDVVPVKMNPDLVSKRINTHN